VAGLSDADAARPVPTCPKWVVRDVVAHVVGVAVDNANGNMDGAPGDAWTAAQVDARRDRSMAELVAEWQEVAPTIEPSMGAAGVADVASHEQDIRTGLGRPGDRDNDAIAWCNSWLVPRLGGLVAGDGLPALRLRLGDDEQLLGEGDGAVLMTVTPFDFFRASFGRRSRSQVEGLFTGGDPGPYVERMVIFGPAVTDITE